MRKSLFWKEWRLNRGAIYGTLLLFLGWIGVTWLGIWLGHGGYQMGYPNRNDWWAAEKSIRIFGYYILCSILACGIAATSFADEKGKKTLAFLSIQPLSRTKIWLTKTIFGLMFIALVYIAIMIMHRFTGSPLAFTQDFYFIQSGTGTPIQDTPYLPYSLYLILMMYTLTMIFSAFLDNTAVTILAGCTGTFILYLGLGFIGGIYCWQFDWQDAMRLFLPLSVIFLMGSHILFCKSDYWDKSRRNKWVYRVIFLSVTLLFLSLIPYGIGVVNFHPRDINNISLIGANTDEQKMVFIVKEEAGESRIWTVNPKRYIAGRGCNEPVISPPLVEPIHSSVRLSNLIPRQVASISDRSYFGWRRADRQTRIWLMNLDGSHKRCLPTKDKGFGHDINQGDPALIWSPDGTKLAYRKTVFLNKKRNKSEDQLCIFNLKTSIEKTIPLPEKDNSGWYLKSWFADNHSLYIGYPPQPENGISLGACYRIRIDGTIIDKHYHYGANQGACSSPDGKWQVFSDVDKKNNDWHMPSILKNLETGNLISVSTSSRFGKLFWSPDSRYLGFIETQETYIPITVKHAESISYQMLLPDKRKIYEDTQVYTIHSLWYIPLIDSAQPIRIDDTVSMQSPVWAPDGNKIAYIHIRHKQSKGINVAIPELYIYDMQQRTSNYIDKYYNDLIWMNNEQIAFVQNNDSGIPRSVLFAIQADRKDRKQLFP